MSVSIDWITKVITIPQAYLTPLGGGVYELDIDQFRLDLRDLEDGETGVVFLPTHQHNSEVVLSGATYARMILLINGYTITFEDGQYAVNAVGANSNIADVMNVNQVSLRSFNAAGLISVTSGSGVTEQDMDDIVDKVFDEDLSEHVLPLSASIALRSGVYRIGVITYDSVNGVPGTGYPIGTTYYPSSNFTDTLLIMLYGKTDDLVLRSDLVVNAGHDISNKVIRTIGLMGTSVVLTAGCNADKAAFRNVDLSGEINGGDEILVYDCSIGDFMNFKGIMNNVSFLQGAEISLDGWATIIQGTCGGEPTNEVEINIGTASLNMTHWTGNLKLTGKTGTDRTVINCDSGNIIIDSTCVAGIIQILGTGIIEADNSGAGCQVDIDGFSSVENIADAVRNAVAIGNRAIEFVLATEDIPVRNVAIGEIDYMTIRHKTDNDSDWSSPVKEQSLYYWYTTLGDQEPIEVKEDG